MNKRIFYIIGAAVLIFLLLLGLWFWLFGGKSSTVSQVGDLFGSGTTTSSGSGGAGGEGNGQAPVGSTVGANNTSGSQTYGSSGVNGQTPIGYSSGNSAFNNSGSNITYGNSTVTFSGATWLDGSYNPSPYNPSGYVPPDFTYPTWPTSTTTPTATTTYHGGTGTFFTPTPINAVDNSSLSGTPYIVNSASGGSGTEIGLAAGLLGAAGGCVANYLSAQGVALAASLFPNPLNFIVVQTNSTQNNTNQAAQSIMDCLVRSLARIAIRQITAETVNWINSGFDGKPQFVQDYKQFFTDVADQAAGQFIQGSGLSFLCSPFQLQVRVAIAQSYARRQSGAAQSCSLSSAVGNIDKFMNGDFSQGGWPGLISFTTVPTNNPFGAYAYGQIALTNAQGQAVSVAGQEVQASAGFLPLKKCDIDVRGVTMLETCKITTPGSIVAEPLRKVIGSDVDSLGLANSVDEILNALTNSLIKKAYQGLSSLGSNNGSASLTTQDAEATKKASDLLQKMQAYVQYAQQYGSVEQGSIQDIQNTQSSLNTLANCWVGAGEDSKQQSALDKVTQLEDMITPLNTNITRANAAIATLQQLQSQVYLARTAADVDAIDTSFTSATLSGNLISDTDLSLATQNRTSLQAQMATINVDTSTQLQQCNAR